MQQGIFTDEKINKLYQEYYELNKNKDIVIMSEDLDNIDLTLKKDFDIIRIYNEYKERELIKIQCQMFLFSLFGLRKKSFDKYIENSSKLVLLENEREEYFENFALDLDNIENSLINTFNTYYDMVYEKEVVEVYTIYKIIIASIIHMLPETYKQDLLATDHFNNIKNDLAKLESYKDFSVDCKTAFDIKTLHNILREYINEKYGIDLYDYSLNKERK